jgi:hypothetical protein
VLAGCSDSIVKNQQHEDHLSLHTSTVDLPNENFGICGGSTTPNSYQQGVDGTCLSGAGSLVLTVSAPGGLEGTVTAAMNQWNFYLNKMPGIRKLALGSGGIPFTIHAASSSSRMLSAGEADTVSVSDRSRLRQADARHSFRQVGR